MAAMQIVPASNKRYFNQLQPSYGAIVPYTAPSQVAKRRSTNKYYGSSGVINTNRRRKRGMSINSTFNTRSASVYPRPEVKFSDTVFGTIAAPLPIDAGGIVPISLNNIGIGSLATNRLGMQISSKSVFFNITFQLGAAPTTCALRHMLVWDRQSNGALPTAAMVLQDPTTPLTSPLNMLNKSRFFVLVDERMILSAQGDNIIYTTGFRKVNQVSTFDPSATPTSNQPYTGNLVVLMWSNIPTGATANTKPTYVGYWRFRYMDN